MYENELNKFKSKLNQVTAIHLVQNIIKHKLSLFESIFKHIEVQKIKLSQATAINSKH